MTEQLFSRSNYTQLWLTLSASETLGLLGAAYLEDYNGVDGQISLYHAASDQRFAMPMSEIPGPLPHDTFRGWVDLTTLPDGLYAIQGHVRDSLGNVTVLGATATPWPGATVVALEFDITRSAGLAPLLAPLAIAGTPHLTRDTRALRAPLTISALVTAHRPERLTALQPAVPHIETRRG